MPILNFLQAAIVDVEIAKTCSILCVSQAIIICHKFMLFMEFLETIIIDFMVKQERIIYELSGFF